ncbi:acyltransferase [Sphingomonas sp. ZB1N12]|uniref:acyltransferase family protein n=1 Tax=Sphingomonas arabinosi TaxID=3096160 RepID=UPI002FCCAFD9
MLDFCYGIRGRNIFGSVRSSSLWLDLIRGLAALVVFFGHARVLLIGSVLGAIGTGLAVPKSQSFEAIPITGPGHEAVVVFFVLSGYLVGGSAIRSARNGTWSSSGYTIQRLSRLWTVLIPVLIFGFALDRLGISIASPNSIYGAPGGQRMVFPDLASRMSVKNLLLNLFFLQEILGKPFGTNGPLWSLAYEFWFYAAFPFLMFAVIPRRKWERLKCIIVLLIIGGFVGPKISLYFALWLLGVAVDLAPKRIPLRYVGPLFALCGLSFVSLLGVLIYAKLHIAISDAIQGPAFAVLCYVIAHLTREIKIGYATAAIRKLAGFSYTLYAVHAPLLVFACAMWMPIWRPWSLNLSGIAKYAATTAVVMLIAYGFYWLFERNTATVRRRMERVWDFITVEKGLFGRAQAASVRSERNEHTAKL